jgi:hypothetical protein
MKKFKLLLLIAAILLLLSNINAQGNKKKNNSPQAPQETKCFNEASHVINLGVGFGGVSYYDFGRSGAYTYKTSPALSISYEQSLPKKTGPGFIGLGTYFGYQSAYYRYNDFYYNNDKYYYQHNWTYLFIAARGAYHPDALSTKNAELYFGGVLGLRIQKYSYQTNSIDPQNQLYALNSGSVFPGYSIFAGGRYFFTQNVGLYAELGYGISYLTGGLSFKF